MSVENELAEMIAIIVNEMASRVDNPNANGWYIDTSDMTPELKEFWRRQRKLKH